MQSEANLDQLASKENGLGGLEINGKEEKSILESQRAVTGERPPLVLSNSCPVVDPLDAADVWNTCYLSTC